MARTTRYVTRTAGGGGSGTSGSPWTLAEAITNAAAGDDMFLADDGTDWTITADRTMTVAGTSSNPIRWIGGVSSITDGWQGFGTDGFLNTANMPTLAFNNTYRLRITGASNIFVNLKVTGSVNNALMDLNGVGSAAIGCSVTNSNTGASAHAIALFNHTTTRAYFCDALQSGASGGAYGIYQNVNGMVYGCRSKSVSGPAFVSNYGYGKAQFVKCMGYDSVTGLSLISTLSGGYAEAIGCTFQGNSGNGVDVASGFLGGALITNCVITDNGGYGLDGNGMAGTIFDCGNRYRDNALGDTLLPTDSDGCAFGRITTDTGGVETDYNNDGSTDWRLVRGSPGHGFGTNAQRGMSLGACDPYAPAGGGMVGYGNA